MNLFEPTTFPGWPTSPTSSARLGLERRLADAETEERPGTRHSERLPSHGSEEHLEGVGGDGTHSWE